MRILKLTTTQGIRLMDSASALERVLDEVKREVLTGEALLTMKDLESAVQLLESVRIRTRPWRKS